MDNPQIFMVCAPESSSTFEPQIFCGNVENVPYYAKAVQGHFLTTEQYQALKIEVAPYDQITGAGYFSFGLGVVVACWMIAYAAGLVVQSVRSL